MSLALATLLYEWRRYTAAVVALAFSGLLILAQVGMFTGIVKGATATIDRSSADIMILPAKMESLINSGGGSLPGRLLPQMYMNPEVVEVAAWDSDGGRWVNRPKDGKKAVTTFINVNMVDTRPGSVNLPKDFPEDTRVALLEPYSVAIDETQLKRLGVKLGDEASLNGKTVRVRAILHGYPDVNNASVTMSRDSLRLMGMQVKGGKTGPLMIRVKDPARTVAVRDQLNKEAKGVYRAWTRQELAEANEGAIMGEQIIGIFLGFSVFLGFLIGVGITSQTLRGAILSSIKEFASLRALGVGMGSLRLIVLELSFWVGIVGLMATALFTGGVYLLATNGGLPMGFPAPWVIGVSILLLVISGFSGLLALGILKKSQPADLLR
ncbi:MAG: ABC transporter permease [Alphaproteobacteria bacterium]|nr:ABC transporter permease [Alphaproteobacteria bacterium]MBU1515515.1 ABC transporter permease [Alphaproteobacteria bacterium]MBU2095513.1 ABC transporter permease [Alphaproteobacteria bacterium]MBU2150754.1 ABC transporter permease [Alphaproteobacteria bacterium]MBU2307019.1 ABC transporter permease [Alphaproteobacteria bacterium]